MIAHLQVLLGRERGRVQSLGSGTFSAGRGSDNDVILSSDLVSRRHVQIVVGEDAVTFSDLGSSNGTFINGARVVGEGVATEGDVVLVGDFAFRFYRGAVPVLSDDWKDNRHLPLDPPAQTKIAGRLDEIPPSTLLRYLSVLKKTGMTMMTSPPHIGQITMMRGHVGEVLVGGKRTRDPIQALIAIMRWRGIFEFEAQAETPASPLLGLDAVLPAIGNRARPSAFPKA